MTVAEITAELNVELTKSVSTKTIQRDLHKQVFSGRAEIPKLLSSDANASK